MVGAVSVALPAWKLLLQYGIEIFVVFAGVMVAAYPIFHLPRTGSTAGSAFFPFSWSCRKMLV